MGDENTEAECEPVPAEPNAITIQPYADHIALNGNNAPKIDKIDDLIRLLVTIRRRYGNTAVVFSIQWGASALWARSQLRSAIEILRQYASKTRDYWDRDEDSKVGKRLAAMSGELKGYDVDVDEALAEGKP